MSPTPVRRIALLFEYPTLNGGERSMLAVLDWLNAHDRQFEFVAVAPAVGRLGDALRSRGIAVHDWSAWDTAGIRHSPEQIVASLTSIIASIRPVLLHANSLAMGRLAGRMASALRVPTASHLRDIVKLSPAVIADLSRNHRLVAVSNATRLFHVDQGIEERRVTVVYNGVDSEQFRPRIASGRLHAELGLPRSANGHRKCILIATIGQIGLRKGLDQLAAAAPAIIDRVPDAHFVLIGERKSQKDESVAYEEAIHRAFDTAGRSDRLHMLGHRDDVAELLNEVDILIHPANQEPFGRVLLEASATGIPIVATDVGGTSEIVENEVTGLLVPPKDPAALASAAVAILTDDSLRHQFGSAARERTVRDFPVSTSARNLSQIWNDVITSSVH